MDSDNIGAAWLIKKPAFERQVEVALGWENSGPVWRLKPVPAAQIPVAVPQ
jgi:hypothetical protein